MKIGINALFIRPGINGGTETYTRELIRNFGALGLPDEFVVYGIYPEIADWCAPFGNFSFRRIPLVRSMPLRIVYEQTAYPRIVERDRIDVLFSPGYVGPLRGRFSSVVTVHDMFSFVCPQYLTRTRALYLRAMLPRGIKRSHAVIAVSETTAGDIVRFFPFAAAKLRVVQEAADERFRPGPAALADAGLAEPYLLSVSTIWPVKNQANLIRGYAEARREFGVRHHLVMVGRDAMGTMQALAGDLGVSEFVHFTGFIPFEKLLAYYRSAAVFVAPSLYEGFGLPVLEAMACGCPVICSAIPVFKEVAGDAALSFEPLDTAGLASQIARLVSDTGLADSLRKKGLETARQYSWRSAAEQTYAVLRQAGEGGGPLPAVAASAHGARQ